MCGQYGICRFILDALLNKYPALLYECPFNHIKDGKKEAVGESDLQVMNIVYKIGSQLTRDVHGLGELPVRNRNRPCSSRFRTGTVVYGLKPESAPPIGGPVPIQVFQTGEPPGWFRFGTGKKWFFLFFF